MTHNGGLTQLNMSHPQVGGDFPFLNNWLNGQGWSCRDNTTPLDFTKHDANGFMHTLYGTGVTKVFFVPSQTDRPGNYVVTWDGGGTISRGFTASTVSGSLTALAGTTNNRCEFSTSATSFSLGVSAVAADGGGAGNYPTNIRVCHVDDEVALNAAYVAGRPWEWGVKFLQRLNELKPGALRFLNVVQNNSFSSLTTWENRKTTTYYDYGATGYVPPALWAGTTTNVGDAYTLAFPGFTKVDKAVAIFNFNANSVGASPTIIINGTGATLMKDNYVNVDGGSSLYDPVRYPKIKRVCALTYDADLACYVMQGGSTEGGDGGTCSGWPYEICVDLCKVIGAHCSIPVSRFALDPITNFVSQFCAYALVHLSPLGLKLQLEGPNETWNTQGGFTNTYYAKEKEKLRNGNVDNDWDQWYGRAMSVMGKAMSTAFSGDRSKYDCISAVHTYFGVPTDQNNRVLCARYVTETGVPGDAAKFWITRVDCTGYWNVTQRNTAVETAAATAYAAATTDAARATIVANFMNDPLGPGVGLAGLYAKYTAYKAWIDGLGQTIAFGQYEGGYSPDYGGNGTIDAFRAATKNYPGAYQMTLQNYTTFTQTNGGVFPSCYRFSGPNDAWPVLDPSIYVSPDPPQWTAMVHFNNRIRRGQAVGLQFRI